MVGALPPRPDDGGGSLGLHRKQARHPLKEPRPEEILEAPGEPSENDSVPGWNHHHIRLLRSQGGGNLQRGGLLPLGRERVVAGVAAVPAELERGLHGQIECLVIGPIYQKDLGAVN